MKRVGFRGRLFLILIAFALVPSILISLVWSSTGSFVLPLVGATAAWDSVAGTGERAIASVRSTPLTDAQRRAVDLHDETLKQSRVRAQQIALLFRRAAQRLALATVIAILIIGVIASRVAGHLSRNLSRPLQELVGWTERIGRGEPLPTSPPRRGAPEFEVLRGRMRHMSAELDLGRSRAIEAERSAALRESARQVAHELKNPLTPIRFAVERLRRDAPPELAETVEVLSVESKRLEAMAKSFAQFGRLPDGPRAEIDVGEMVRYTARATVPPDQLGDVDVDENIPMIHGHHDALARALSNVMLNAVDACGPRGRVAVRARQIDVRGNEAIEVTVSDTGCGIPREQLARIWDPYVTSKPGGTGLGLAIARQTVLAHSGSVSAESMLGSGTSIRFVLPVNGGRTVREGGDSNGAH